MFLLFGLQIIAQNTEQSSYFSHEIKYVDGKSSYYNDILEKISQTGTKNKYVPSIYYSFKIKYQITDAGIGMGRVVVSMNDFLVGMNSKLKAFDVTSLLVPSVLQCNLYVMSSSSQIVCKVPVAIKNISPNSFVVIDTIIKIKQPLSDLKLKLDNYVYFLSYDSYAKFNDLFKVVDEYNKSNVNIHKSLSVIKTIDLKNVDMMQVYDIRLDEVEQYYYRLMQLNLQEKLMLSKADPENYLVNIAKLKDQIELLRLKINEMLATLDLCYYNEAKRLLTERDTIGAMGYLKGAIGLNILNIKSQAELTRLELTRNQTEKTSARLIDFYKIATPYGDDANEMMAVLSLLNNHYLAMGEREIEAKDYNKAIAVLSNCYELCNNISVFPCGTLLFNAMQTAKMGMYNSYLSVIQKSIDMKLWGMAETYIIQARKYQEENKTFILDNTKTDKMLAKVYNRYILAAEKNYDQEFYDSAIESYKKALALCQKHNATCESSVNEGIYKCEAGVYTNFVKQARRAAMDSLTGIAEDFISKAKKYQQEHESIKMLKGADSLLGSLKGIFYHQYIVEAKRSLSYSRYKDALLSLLKARGIENSYIVASNPELPELLKHTTTSYILTQNEGIDFLIWANKLDSAQKTVDELVYYSSVAGVASDSAVAIFVKLKNEKIATRFCSNIKTEFEKCRRLAEENIAQHNFVTADDYLKKAIKVASSTNRCGIDTVPIHNREVAVGPIAQYQLLLGDAKSDVIMKKYRLANNAYLKAEELFLHYEMGKWGLSNDSIAVYISKTSDYTYIDSSLVQFLEERRFENALRLVFEAKLRGVNTKIIRSSQKQLGKDLELLDYKEHAIVDALFIKQKYGRYSRLTRFMFTYKLRHARRNIRL